MTPEAAGARIRAMLDEPFGRIPDLIALHAIATPERLALIQDERTMDFRALDARMDRVATALQRDGLVLGDAIAICGASSFDYVALYLGALRVGVVVAPLSPSSGAVVLERMTQDADARLLFADDEILAELAGRSLPKTVSLDSGVAVEAWLAPEGARPTPVDVRPESPFNIIYSSGTTGEPKGIVQPSGMRWSQVQRGRVMGYDQGAISLFSTPLYSNTTLAAFFPTIGLGGSSVLMAKFDVRRWLEIAERHRVTHTMLVPVQYRRILADPEFDRFDLSAFRVKSSTSAPFAADVKAEVLRRWPGGLVEIYGMTEGGGACLLEAHKYPDKLHTVGKPAPNHDIRLIDDDGKELGPGATGEVVGHSPSMMIGYRNQPQKSAEMEWFDATGKRFIRSGDVGRFDADGFLTLVDRKKDMIISGGFNLYPSDLEAVLRDHPDLDDCTVVGVPSERWGETPVAFVVAKAGASVDPLAVMAWANERLGKMQRLSDVRLVDHLPRSPIGKVLKRELRATYV